MTHRSRPTRRDARRGARGSGPSAFPGRSGAHGRTLVDPVVAGRFPPAGGGGRPFRPSGDVPTEVDG
ncbi:hypothetical protein GZL_07011 [Streptomyces sp. 769]|nr:hypothetical protein GZL_07011 [Streptomyces sp. 769]